MATAGITAVDSWSTCKGDVQTSCQEQCGNQGHISRLQRSVQLKRHFQTLLGGAESAEDVERELPDIAAAVQQSGLELWDAMAVQDRLACCAQD